MKNDYEDKVVLPEIKRQRDILQSRKHQSTAVDLVQVKSHAISYAKHIDQLNVERELKRHAFKQ